MKEKRVKETRLGEWLREKAPNVLDAVGDALPEQGVLGIIKNLVNTNEKDGEFVRAMAEAEVAAQESVTKRWEVDMTSDTKLAKIVRPVTLISLMGLYLILAVWDSIGSADFEVKESYVDLLQVLMLTAFGAYFAGRSMEKVKR